MIANVVDLMLPQLLMISQPKFGPKTVGGSRSALAAWSTLIRGSGTRGFGEPQRLIDEAVLLIKQGHRIGLLLDMAKTVWSCVGLTALC